MTVLPARWRKVLLLFAWSLLERWRIRLVRCQRWLERRFGGWGEEIGFASDTGRWDDQHTAAVPEHWAALVRRGAPWLLRQPAPPGGTGPALQQAPNAASPKTGVGTAPSGVNGTAASVYEDDAAVPTQEARGRSRALPVDTGHLVPGHRLDVSPQVPMASPLPDVAASRNAAGIAGSARRVSVTRAYRDGVTPGGNLTAVRDEPGSFGAATAPREQEHPPVAERGADTDIALSSLVDAVAPVTHYTRAEPGLSAAWPTPGSDGARIENSRQRSADVFVSPTSRTVAPSWPALPGEEEGSDRDGWPDLPGTAGTSVAGDDADAWDESQEQRWSA